MGGSASKSRPESTAVQNSVLDSSSGLHLFEVHTPTLGAGLGIVLLLALATYFLCARLRKRGNAHRVRNVHPWNDYDPRTQVSPVPPFTQYPTDFSWTPLRHPRPWSNSFPLVEEITIPRTVHRAPVEAARFEYLDDPQEGPSSKKSPKK